MILFSNSVITEELYLANNYYFTPLLDTAWTVSRLGTKTMLDKQFKQEIIEKFRQHEGDTGSTQVQIAILTEEIKQLTEHLQKHRHDFSSRRGLLRKVGERRRLLKYLQKEDEKSFIDLATKLI